MKARILLALLEYTGNFACFGSGGIECGCFEGFFFAFGQSTVFRERGRKSDRKLGNQQLYPSVYSGDS